MASADRFDGMQILVVEDDYFIAMGIMEFLTEAGARVLGPAGTLDEALRLVAAHGEEIRGASLDVNLRGARIYPVADVLLARNIPFVLSTGYDMRGIPETYSEVPRFEKPVDPQSLIHELLIQIQRVTAATSQNEPPPDSSLGDNGQNGSRSDAVNSGEGISTAAATDACTGIRSVRTQSF